MQVGWQLVLTVLRDEDVPGVERPDATPDALFEQYCGVFFEADGGLPADKLGEKMWVLRSLRAFLLPTCRSCRTAALPASHLLNCCDSRHELSGLGLHTVLCLLISSAMMSIP